jgi:hypothetical protein
MACAAADVTTATTMACAAADVTAATATVTTAAAMASAIRWHHDEGHGQ